jgi:hypothetical protein
LEHFSAYCVRSELGIPLDSGPKIGDEK